MVCREPFAVDDLEARVGRASSAADCLKGMTSARDGMGIGENYTIGPSAGPSREAHPRWYERGRFWSEIERASVVQTECAAVYPLAGGLSAAGARE